MGNKVLEVVYLDGACETYDRNWIVDDKSRMIYVFSEKQLVRIPFENVKRITEATK